MGKTPRSHVIHSLGGEYCWIVRDSKPIRLLESPRSLSGYILMSHVWCPTSDVQNPMFDVQCPLSDAWCPTSDALSNSDVRCPISMCDVRCLMSGQRTRQKNGQRSKQEIEKKKRTKKGPRDRQKFGRKIGQKIEQKRRETIGQKNGTRKPNITWPLGDTNFIFECGKYLILMFLFLKVKILMKKRKIMLVTMATPISSHVEIKIVSSLRAMKIWFFSKRKNPGISSVSI